MGQIEMTAEEVMDSLTGHDEMAIAQHFSRTASDLAEKDPVMLGRALVFVAQRRLEGVNDDDARNFAMDLPLKQVLAYFPDEGSDESGKGELELEQQPEDSLSSVS